jgi:hypothetical protein
MRLNQLRAERGVVRHRTGPAKYESGHAEQCDGRKMSSVGHG